MVETPSPKQTWPGAWRRTKCWSGVQTAGQWRQLPWLGQTLPPLHPRCIVLASLIKEVAFETEPGVAGERRLYFSISSSSSSALLSPTSTVCINHCRQPPVFPWVFGGGRWWMSDGLVMSCYCASRCIRASPMISGHREDNVSLIAWSMAHRRSRGGRCWEASDEARCVYNAFTASGMHTKRDIGLSTLGPLHRRESRLLPTCLFLSKCPWSLTFDPSGVKCQTNSELHLKIK